MYEYSHPSKMLQNARLSIIGFSACYLSRVIFEVFHGAEPQHAEPQHDLIHDMIRDGSLVAAQMADVAGCSKHSIKAIRSNLHYFGTTKAPPKRWWGASFHYASYAKSFT
jgi:hypothetical protein